MSSIVLTALICVTLLLLLNLALTFGTIRRLRDHTRLLSLRGASGVPETPLIAPPGSTVRDFRAPALDGRTLDLESLRGPALVGFFSTECGGCREGATTFVQYAEAFAREVEGGTSQILSVIAGQSGGTELLTELRHAGQIILEPEGGPVQEAFQVTGFPAFCLLGAGGQVIASGFDLRSLPLPQPLAGARTAGARR
jgi:hypothetical protein